MTSLGITLNLSCTEGWVLSALLILALDHASLSTAHLLLQKQQRLNGLFTVYKLTRVWIITGNQSLFLQVKDWVCNDPGCPSLWWVLLLKKKKGSISHLPKLSKFGDKKMLSLNIHGNVSGKSWGKKTLKKGSKWNSTYRDFSVLIFENLLFCPFFQRLQTNKNICKKKIYIDHT